MCDQQSKKKTVDDNFSDWENTVFGMGYGTGEEYTVPALKQFLAACPDEGTYDHEKLSDALGPVVAWLLINILVKADIIEYGSSPRFGWLTKQGQTLRAYVKTKTAAELVALSCRDSDYVICYPDACNCGPDGYEPGRECANEFWRDPNG